MRFHIIKQAVLLAICASLALAAPEDKPARNRGTRKQPTQNSSCNNVPVHPLDVVLGRPTRDSITLSVLAYQDTEGTIAYGTQSGSLRNKPQRGNSRKANRSKC